MNCLMQHNATLHFTVDHWKLIKIEQRMHCVHQYKKGHCGHLVFAALIGKTGSVSHNCPRHCLLSSTTFHST